MLLANVLLKGRTVLAPMAGITDSVYRQICKQFGAAVVLSEMVSSEGLIRRDHKSIQYLKFDEKERPMGIQLFGANPDVMAEAARVVESYSPDFIDLNFGCPVKKVVRKGAGAAILKDVHLLADITIAVRQATSLPLTAKIRSGWSASQINAIEVAHILEDCGADAITVHPRTQNQYFQNHADWEIIRLVKETVNVPVIGNGDIKNPDDAERMLKQTRCDMVMVGRAALGNPWIFEQIEQFLNTGSFKQVSNDQRLNVCMHHVDFLIQERGTYSGIRKMRKHLAWYIKNLPHSSAFRASLIQLTEVNQVKNALKQYFENMT